MSVKGDVLAPTWKHENTS